MLAGPRVAYEVSCSTGPCPPERQSGRGSNRVLAGSRGWNARTRRGGRTGSLAGCRPRRIVELHVPGHPGRRGSPRNPAGSGADRLAAHRAWARPIGPDHRMTEGGGVVDRTRLGGMLTRNFLGAPSHASPDGGWRQCNREDGRNATEHSQENASGKKLL